MASPLSAYTTLAHSRQDVRSSHSILLALLSGRDYEASSNKSVSRREAPQVIPSVNLASTRSRNVPGETEEVRPHAADKPAAGVKGLPYWRFEISPLMISSASKEQ